MGTEFAAAPGRQLPQVGGQLQGVVLAELGQAFAVRSVQGGGAQGLVGAQVVQQGLGRLRRAQRLRAERRVAEQAGEGLHGLGRHALLGNPVGGADEGQVGGQQYGGQQHQQGGQQLAADRQIVQAPLQAHGGFARGLGSGQGSGASGIGQSACAQTPAQILQQGFQPRQGEAEAGTLPAGV